MARLSLLLCNDLELLKRFFGVFFGGVPKALVLLYSERRADSLLEYFRNLFLRDGLWEGRLSESCLILLVVAAEFFLRVRCWVASVKTRIALLARFLKFWPLCAG